MSPLDSGPENPIPAIDEERLMRAAAEYIESAYPNPDRIGCPSHGELGNIVRRKGSVSDILAGLDHVTSCSPCFAEYRIMRYARKRKRTAGIALVITAAAMIAIFGILLYRGERREFSSQPSRKSVEVASGRRELTIDLRSYTGTRGGAPSTAHPRPILTLPRANLSLTFQLPVGSREGRYHFELLDSNGAMSVETSGNARSKDFVMTVETAFDLRSLRPGRFTLIMRPDDGTDGTPFPVEVQ
jgi:hypothetical protein